MMLELTSAGGKLIATFLKIYEYNVYSVLCLSLELDPCRVAGIPRMQWLQHLKKEA